MAPKYNQRLIKYAEIIQSLLSVQFGDVGLSVKIFVQPCTEEHTYAIFNE